MLAMPNLIVRHRIRCYSLRNSLGKNRRIPGMPIFVRVALLVLFLSAFSARADITLTPAGKPEKGRERTYDLPPPPPEPVPVSVKVKRGGTVEIPLRVFGLTNEPLTYRIRKGPALGKLSEIKMEGKGMGVITYQHSGEKTRDSDEILFASQTAAGVSVAVRIDIAIVDDAPVLTAPAGLEPGTVLIGATVTRQLLIENSGGGVLKGTVTVDEPWKIDGKAAYNLRAGETQVISLKLTPDEEKALTGEVHYSSHPRQLTELHADAKATIGVTPSPLELAATAEDPMIRAGVLQIVNRSAEEQPLRLHTGRGLTAPDRVTVPANGEIAVPIATAPGQLGLVTDMVQVDSPSFATKIAVQAPAVGPIVRTNPVTLAFGKIEAHDSVTATMQVSNSGGTRAQIQVLPLAILTVDPADSTFWLEPGATRDVRLTLQSRDAGPLADTLRIKASGAELTIPVEAEVTARPVLARAAPMPAAPVIPLRSLSPIEDVRLTRLTATACEISWRVVTKTRPRFEIERAVPVRSGLEWTGFSSVAIETPGATRPVDAGENLAMHGVTIDGAASPDPAETATAVATSAVTARLYDLSPNSDYRIRIVAINPKDASDRVTIPVQFRTPRTQLQTIARYVLLPAALVLLVVVWWRRWTSPPVRSSAPAPTPAPADEPITFKPLSPIVPPALRREGEPDPKPRQKVPNMKEISPGTFFLDVD